MCMLETFKNGKYGKCAYWKHLCMKKILSGNIQTQKNRKCAYLLETFIYGENRKCAYWKHICMKKNRKCEHWKHLK